MKLFKESMTTSKNLKYQGRERMKFTRTNINTIQVFTPRKLHVSDIDDPWRLTCKIHDTRRTLNE